MTTSFRSLAQSLIALALVLGSSAASADGRTIPIYIAPPIDGAGDAELARWAFQSYQRASGEAIRFSPAPEKSALVRLYWVGHGRAGGFGEMRPIVVDGKAGAELFVNTEMELYGVEIAGAARADKLYRDTIVYLTCVHELGHGLGLQHTAEYLDIMYSFQYGGDIPAYFRRYRQRLAGRADIARTDAFSDGDLSQLRNVLARQ
jgi:hypothetical protein